MATIKSIEEKAKRYDEVKYIMKEYLESGNAGVIAENTIKKAFPELAESEDERIRKELIEYFRWNVKQILNDFSNKECIAWLEKQQKPEVDQHSLPVSDDSSLPTLDESIYHPYTEKAYEHWSEEDEKEMATIEHHLNNCGASITSILWFKSLKERYAWEPTDEQIEALSHMIDAVEDEWVCEEPIVRELLKQLKKLRGELL